MYANEAARIDGKDKNGALAEVRASDGRFIGKGYINHLSKILVRIFLRGDEEDGEELYEARIARGGKAARAVVRGAGYGLLPPVFAEADGRRPHH